MGPGSQSIRELFLETLLSGVCPCAKAHSFSVGRVRGRMKMHFKQLDFLHENEYLKIRSLLLGQMGDVSKLIAALQTLFRD